MMCKLVKRGVVGATLGAGALALLFGTAAPSYVKTAYHKTRQAADDSVPVPFKIDVARQQLRDLEPAMASCIENVSRSEVKVEALQAEIVAARESLEREKMAIAALRKHRDQGDVQLTGGLTYTPAEVDRELARRFDRYSADKKIVAEQESTLAARKKAVQAAREQLDNMKAAKSVLLSKIETIEAKYRQLEANRAAAETVTFDDSALSRLKQTVHDLEERVNIEERIDSHRVRLIEPKTAVEPGRDVLKEIDAEFGNPAKDSTASAHPNF